MQHNERVPSCPACGAKFSFDPVRLRCSKCLVPQEIVAAGGRAIARWKRNPTGEKLVGNVIVPNMQLVSLSKRARKAARLAGRQRRRNVHGRAHA